jgi:hypothetical protein
MSPESLIPHALASAADIHSLGRAGLLQNW